MTRRFSLAAFALAALVTVPSLVCAQQLMEGIRRVTPQYGYYPSMADKLPYFQVGQSVVQAPILRPVAPSFAAPINRMEWIFSVYGGRLGPSQSSVVPPTIYFPENTWKWGDQSSLGGAPAYFRQLPWTQPSGIGAPTYFQRLPWTQPSGIGVPTYMKLPVDLAHQSALAPSYIAHSGIFGQPVPAPGDPGLDQSFVMKAPNYSRGEPEQSLVILPPNQMPTHLIHFGGVSNQSALVPYYIVPGGVVGLPARTPGFIDQCPQGWACR